MWRGTRCLGGYDYRLTQGSVGRNPRRGKFSVRLVPIRQPDPFMIGAGLPMTPIVKLFGGAAEAPEQSCPGPGQSSQASSADQLNDVFVGRQPLLDRELRLVGYELLFRNGAVDAAVVVDNEAATATVLLNSITEIGFDRVVGGRPAWVNISADFIRNGLVELLPAGALVLEILEDQEIDDQVLAKVSELKLLGHRFALDDFELTPDTERLLKLVEFVKLDLLALGRERLLEIVNQLKPYGVTLVAEKLETYQDQAFCAQAGCDLFQGYFFCRPELIAGRRIDANRAALLELLSALHDPDVELADLHRRIEMDVGLSFRLMRYINSPFFGLRMRVGSIGQAVALLGFEQLKQWITLTLFMGIDDQPTELTVTALVRARFCELAAQEYPDGSSRDMFTLGLFSVIDALLRAPMAELLSQIPLTPDTCAALIERAGRKGQVLDCVTAIEAGDLERAETILPAAGQLYVTALAWTDDVAQELLTH